VGQWGGLALVWLYMSLPDNLQFDPAQFSGVVRLFPLPNLVLFPHVLQPLHIFEPRYCDMLEDALASDRLIAMAVLVPGWEKDYEGRPPVRPVACLGQIATHVRLADGRHNLLLAGVARVRLGLELAPTASFRRAPAEIRVDHYPAKLAAEQRRLTRQLFGAFRGALPATPEAQAPLAQLLNKDIDLGTLTDIVAYTLDLDVSCKADLLAESDIHTRATRLLAYLAERPADDQAKFPPEFSAN
jgi:Lon protease-like protein